jgi:hypothetical protein
MGGCVLGCLLPNLLHPVYSKTPNGSLRVLWEAIGCERCLENIAAQVLVFEQFAQALIHEGGVYRDGLARERWRVE